jgi:hypothetical protein
MLNWDFHIIRFLQCFNINEVIKEMLSTVLDARKHGFVLQNATVFLAFGKVGWSVPRKPHD